MIKLNIVECHRRADLPLARTHCAFKLNCYINKCWLAHIDIKIVLRFSQLPREQA